MKRAEKVYIITSTVEAGTVESMPVVPEMQLIRDEDLSRSEMKFVERDKVCITSEYSLTSLIDRLDSARMNAVKILKDKGRFREILKEIYPDLSYKRIKLRELGNLTIEKRSVIKPARGIFGTAVRVVGPDTDFPTLAIELADEIRKNAKVYPDSVLSGEDFILEDFIEGEEYAVDMFYDSHGNSCIVNIFHHPLPEKGAYLHMMYNSSKAAFETIYEKSKVFFSELNNLLRVRNFAMHAELRFHNGSIFPVEINMMRFGGMGLCNLVWYSLGINPFLCFLNDVEPDWNLVWQGKEREVYTFFIAYNGSGIKTDHCRPLPDKLKKQFTRVLHEQPFNHREQLAFGVYFLEETVENIRNLLKTEFDHYFEPPVE